MSIRIKFSQTELRDRASVILSIHRSAILNVCPTCGGKQYLVLVLGDYGKQSASTFTVWQLVDALPLTSKNISADLLLCPQELLQSLSFMGMSMLPTVENLKKAYRKLSKQMHPDVGGNAEDFRILNTCYEQISQYLN
jgi:DnaJ domain